MERTIKLIIPTISTDWPILQKNLDNILKFLPISKILVIGNTDLKSLVNGIPNVIFLDETLLVNIGEVRALIGQRLDKKNIKRSGWYIQQFLKMAYARVCEDNFYLLWDSDTIPVKKIDLFDADGKPYLDYKTEYFKEYFETMNRILPGYTKAFKGSFISEHMLVNTKHMKELLDKIESNQAVRGTIFYEKIINSIDVKDLPKSGFSEFETFGTFLFKNHRVQYTLRRWYSLRRGGYFFNASDLSDNIIKEYLAKSFHAVSFEKGDYKNDLVSKIVKCKFYMGYFSPDSLNILSYVMRGIRKLKEYKKR